MNSPYLGVDLGKRRTGLALSENGLIATPLTTLNHASPHRSEIATQLVEAIKHNGINTIVIGLPLNQDGTPSPQSEWCNLVIRELQDILRQSESAVAIVTVDEYHTTQDTVAENPAANDATAAAAILQTYLDDHA